MKRTDPAYPITSQEIDNRSGAVVGSAHPGMDIRTEVASRILAGFGLAEGEYKGVLVSIAIERANELLDRMGYE